MLKRFGKPQDADFHLNQALGWFAKANNQAKRGNKREWLKAYQEGAKHMWGAKECGLSRAREAALDMAFNQCGQSGQNI